MTIAQERKDQHLGAYLGDDQPDEWLDAQLAYGIAKSDLEDARSLFATKWWDYRYVHPGRCYFLFADLYGKAIEKWRTKFGYGCYWQLKAVGHPIYRTEYDKRGNVQSNPHKVMRPKGTRTGLWRAMCFADHHGIPYDRYIELCFQFCFDNKFQRMPNPPAMYGTVMTMWVVERWHSERANLLRLPTDPRFMAAGYTGHHWQNDFQAELLDLIEDRPVPRIPLEHYLTKECYLVPDIAAKKFGVEMVCAAILNAVGKSLVK